MKTEIKEEKTFADLKCGDVFHTIGSRQLWMKITRFEYTNGAMDTATTHDDSAVTFTTHDDSAVTLIDGIAVRFKPEHQVVFVNGKFVQE